MKTRAVVVLLVSTSILVGGLLAQSVDVVPVLKVHEYNQTDATTTAEKAVNPWAFEVFIDGTGLTASFPSGTNSFTPQGGSAGLFVFDSGNQHWSYQGNASFADQAALDAAFPNGTQSLIVGGIPFTLSLAGNLYPNTPLATASAGTWTGGLLQLTAAQASAGFSITSNTFTGWANDGSFRIGIWGDGSSYSQDVETYAANFLAMNVAGGALTAGNTYSFTVEFMRFTDSDTSLQPTLGVNALGVAGYVINTSFSVQVIPEPSTYAAILGGLALAGVVWRRRQLAGRA
ncbi:MAG: PEP-CTERM sorting domain-containing protein [Candidatus Didemnitutus sp.]|nr:PEP-CTERM sorting domain-containing protein [Candidatus Didemnitutus sp.]